MRMRVVAGNDVLKGLGEKKREEYKVPSSSVMDLTNSKLILTLVKGSLNAISNRLMFGDPFLIKKSNPIPFI